MQNNRFLEGLRRAYARYDRLMEKQGFYIVLAVCVLVILLSALYTFQLRDQWEEPPVPQRTRATRRWRPADRRARRPSATPKPLVESRGAGAAGRAHAGAPALFPAREAALPTGAFP